MATIANQYNPNDPNANNPNAGGGGTVTPSSSGGGASSSGGGAGSAGGSATPYQPPNVSQYLAANQGAGQQLTQGITGNVQNQANQLQNQVNTSKSQLESQAQPLSENLGSKAQSTIQTAFQNPQDLLNAYNAAKTNSSNQPLSSDQQQNAQQYNQFQQLNNGGYNQAIQNYGNIGQQAQNQLQGQLGSLTQQTGAAQNEMGRNQLLQNAVGQGNYNQGEQTLDSLFLQGQPGQRNANGLSNLQQLQQNLGGIGQQASQNVQGLGLDTQNKLAALQGMSAQDQASIKNLFLNGGANGQGLNQIGQDVQGQYNQLAASVPGIQAGISNAFKTNQFTPEQLQQLGIHQGENTWGLTPEQLMAGGNLQNTALQGYAQGGAAQAANANQLSRYNALNQLAGGPSGIQNNIFGSSTQTGYNPVAFDPQALQAAISSKQNTLNTTDFNNALAGVPSTGLTDVFNQAIKGGNMTPEQANEYINNQIQSRKATDDYWNGNGYTNTRQEIAREYQPFTDWYNSQYAPAASSVIGASSPGDTSNQLPTNPGGIDWSKINAPKGK